MVVSSPLISVPLPNKSRAFRLAVSIFAALRSGIQKKSIFYAGNCSIRQHPIWHLASAVLASKYSNWHLASAVLASNISKTKQDRTRRLFSHPAKSEAPKKYRSVEIYALDFPRAISIIALSSFTSSSLLPLYPTEVKRIF